MVIAIQVNMLFQCQEYVADKRCVGESVQNTLCFIISGSSNSHV